MSADMPPRGGPERLTPWEKLSPDEQLALREAYGRYLDTLPPTCSLETKIERFSRWLAERRIAYNV